MAEGRRPSWQEVCDFYKNKNADRVTKAFFEVWYSERRKKGNAYLGMAEGFRSVNFAGKDDEGLYRVLKARQSPAEAKFPIPVYNRAGEELRSISSAAELPDLSFLPDLGDALFQPEDSDQKWHLYVSVLTYKAVCVPRFRWNNVFRKYSCLPLRLWMLENAGADLREIEAGLAAMEDVSGRINKAFGCLLNDGLPQEE